MTHRMIARTGSNVDRRRPAASFGMVGLAALAASPAAAQTRATVDVGAGVSIATNPFLQSGDPDAGASVVVEVSPLLIRQEDRTTLVLRGTAQLRQYLNDYGTEDNYGLDFSGTHVASDQLTLRAGAGVQSSRSALGALQPIGLPFTPGVGGDVGTGTGTDTGTGVVPPVGGVINPPLTGPIAGPGLLPDVTLAGLRVRTTTYDVRGGLDYAPSPLDVVGFDVAGRATRFGGDSLVDNDFVSAEARYSRRLSERTSVGAILSATRTNFFGGDSTLAGLSADSASTLVPMLSVDYRLSDRLTVNAAAGVSFTWTDLPDGSSESTTGFALRGSLCNQTSTVSSLCVLASRQPLPTALGDVRTADNLLVTYSRTLDENDSLSVSGYYNSTSGSPLFDDVPGSPAVFDEGIDLLGASASLSHRFGRRLSGVATLGYTDTFGSGFDVRPNFLASAGLRMTFGAIP